MRCKDITISVNKQIYLEKTCKMEKKYIIGVDPGSASLGLFVRDTEQGKLLDQIRFASVDIIRSGVIESGQNKYTSFAAERRGYRNARDRYLHKKWRKQETLKLLIDERVLDGHIKHLLCPLTKEELERWVRYDKAKGLKREYPVTSLPFSRWIMMDFNDDGKADDYSSPYQIRKELLERQFDFSNMEDCFKLGRALYHIAQKRGFRSSKGESLKEVELPDDESLLGNDDFDIMEYSEQKKCKSLNNFMKERGIEDKSVGFAFALLENEGIRLRDSEYQATRKQLKKEVKTIFEFQEQLSTDSYLYKRLMSEKKGDGTIFYQLPLQSQKGNVEKCTLEPFRKRCQVSHPEFEKYRTWSFINNIRIKLPQDTELHGLSMEMREKLYIKISGIVSKSFDFVSIRRWLEKELGAPSELSAKEKTINFYDDYSVSGCPTIGRLKKILGDAWETWILETEQTRTKRNGKHHHIIYRAVNLWHVCINAENESFVEDFSRKLGFDDNQTKELVRLYKNVSDEYANLSLCALQKINYFLTRGFNNYEATLLANIPTLIGKNLWHEHGEEIEAHMQDIIEGNREKKRFIGIANKLIADYLSQDEREKHAERIYDYQLQDSDLKDVEKKLIDSVGKQSWAKLTSDEQERYFTQVASLYQQFFANDKRTYFQMPTDMDSIKEYLSAAFGIMLDGKNKLYTPYDNQYYPKAILTKNGYQLCSPVKGALRNPAAMRILHLIKRRINNLLKDQSLNITSENTRIVVELPREVNDANMRRAIDIYQNRRKKENDIFKGLIKESMDDEDERLQKTRLLIEQCPEYVLADFNEKFQKNNSYNDKLEYAATKYRLWLEQDCIDLYSGHPIPFSKLFDNNQYDIEHTIPRSIVLEDCLENKTITSASFNRKVKGNLIPSQLANYHTVILPNLKPWQDRVERLQGRVKYWLKETKRAADPERKDYCIVQRHLWQMELDYWSSKLERFTMTEVTSGFVNKQMSDTRVISKYVFHYLKSFFGRVDMQYGSTTATFRKIYGLPEKDRSNHTHHAVDAAVLSFIPSSAKRENMLRLFYQIDEEKKAGNTNDAKRLREELEKEIKLNLYGSKFAKATGGRVIDVINQLKDTILVNHVSKDQTLTPARKHATIKKNGQRIAIIKTGDSLRGQIHKESFFGAIKPWVTDNEGNLLKDGEGHHFASNIKYVKRCKLQYKQGRGEGFTDWNDLEKRIVDKTLFKKLKEQANGLLFKDACTEGFFVCRRVNGNIVKNKIRHVRCEIPSNLSHFPTKKHVFLSDKEYKQYYYAESADLQYCCEYQGSKETAYVSYTLYDLSVNLKSGLEPFPKSIQGKREILYLSRVLSKGDMVLLYRENKEELNTLDKEQKSNRLYKITGFEKRKERTDTIKLMKHNYSAGKDEGKGKSCDDFEQLIQMNKIQMAINKVRFEKIEI